MKVFKVRTAASCAMSLFGALLLTSAALAGPPKKGSKPPTASGDIANGKKVYAANSCANCHSINGQGGSGGPDLTTIGADKTHTAAWFKKAITDPKSIHPDSTMPAYTTLKAKDMTDLCAYLGSLKKKAS